MKIKVSISIDQGLKEKIEKRGLKVGRSFSNQLERVCIAGLQQLERDDEQMERAGVEL